jgi:recombination protein RecR
MDTIERLASLFEKFPGIGPRQAQRFVQYLLRSSPAVRRELAEALGEVGGSVHQCPECMRYHAGTKKLCGICASGERDMQLLAVVAADTDLAALEKSGTYRGRYFVLGGTLHLGSERSSSLRIKELLASLPKRIENGLEEVILAFPANPEGDATAARVREELAPRAASLRITTLGRGLSTGSELEYADPETIKSALESRR